jgi:hypothetical protein
VDAAQLSGIRFGEYEFVGHRVFVVGIGGQKLKNAGRRSAYESKESPYRRPTHRFDDRP